MFDCLGKMQDEQEYLVNSQWMKTWRDYIDGQTDNEPT